MTTVPMYGAVMTLARWEARKEIKRRLYAKGIKLAHVESREITIAANRYIEDHPEIIPSRLNVIGILLREAY